MLGPFALNLALGQDASANEAVSSNWFKHFVTDGGYITFILIGMSVVSIAFTIEHTISIRRSKIVAPDQAINIKELIDGKKYVEAIQYTAEDPTMLSHVVNAGLLEASNGYLAMERAVEEALEERSARLMRKIEYLSIIGAVSPMLGLFGTVYGMIKLFAAIEEAGAIPDPGTIAGAISIALVTTFWGLLVGIPSLLAFGIFRNRIDVLAADCALATEGLLAVFKPGAAERSAVAATATKGRTAKPIPSPSLAKGGAPA